jgi:hypothetical protein
MSATCERCGRTFNSNIGRGLHRRAVRFENEKYPSSNCVPLGPLSQGLRQFGYKYSKDGVYDRRATTRPRGTKP